MVQRRNPLRTSHSINPSNPAADTQVEGSGMAVMVNWLPLQAEVNPLSKPNRLVLLIELLRFVLKVSTFAGFALFSLPTGENSHHATRDLLLPPNCPVLSPFLGPPGEMVNSHAGELFGTGGSVPHEYWDCALLAGRTDPGHTRTCGLIDGRRQSRDGHQRKITGELRNVN